MIFEELDGSLIHTVFVVQLGPLDWMPMVVGGYVLPFRGVLMICVVPWLWLPVDCAPPVRIQTILLFWLLAD